MASWRENSGDEKMAPSYRETNFSRKFQTERLGRERSMWQRQIQ
jgi:hypothetical protein